MTRRGLFSGPGCCNRTLGIGGLLYGHIPLGPVVLANLILIDVEATFLVVPKWINDRRVVSKSGLRSETPNRLLCGSSGFVNTNHLHAFFAICVNVEMLNNKD